MRLCEATGLSSNASSTPSPWTSLARAQRDHSSFVGKELAFTPIILLLSLKETHPNAMTRLVKPFGKSSPLLSTTRLGFSRSHHQHQQRHSAPIDQPKLLTNIAPRLTSVRQVFSAASHVGHLDTHDFSLIVRGILVMHPHLHPLPAASPTTHVTTLCSSLQTFGTLSYLDRSKYFANAFVARAEVAGEAHEVITARATRRAHTNH